MKIKTKDIFANPYRNIDKYPIDREKIEALKNSITQTEFWDNILVRTKPGDETKFELAYGHHRLQALKDLRIEEVDIPVKTLDDATMIQIMANENFETWKANTSTMLETVGVAKAYLERELAKYDWNDLEPQEFLRLIFGNEQTYTSAKSDKGVGQGILKKFLGKNWTDYYIQSALAILKNDNLDQEAIKKIANVNEARIVSQVITDNNIPKAAQKKIIDDALDLVESEKYKEVKTVSSTKEEKRDEGFRTETKLKAATEEAIEKADFKTQKKNFDRVFPKLDRKPDVNKIALIIAKNLNEINASLPEILDNWEYLHGETQEVLIETITELYKTIKTKGAKQWKKLA